MAGETGASDLSLRQTLEEIRAIGLEELFAKWKMNDKIKDQDYLSATLSSRLGTDTFNFHSQMLLGLLSCLGSYDLPQSLFDDHTAGVQFQILAASVRERHSSIRGLEARVLSRTRIWHKSSEFISSH